MHRSFIESDRMRVLLTKRATRAGKMSWRSVGRVLEWDRGGTEVVMDVRGNEE